MANKAALVAVSLAAVAGIAFAVGHADAKPKPPLPPKEDIDLDDNSDSDVVPEPAQPPQPEPPEEEPADQGSGPPTAPESEGGTPGSGSGEPVDANLDLLPSELRNINLSGKERVQFMGVTNLADHTGQTRPFYAWIVFDSLNGMNIDIVKSMENPEDWVAAFLHPDPPGSVPKAHHILYKVSDTANKQWMIENLLVP